MDSQNPTSTDIITDLVDSTVGRIREHSYSAFEEAYNALIDQQVFLFDSLAAKDESGNAFSYSEVPAGYYSLVQNWMREYRRLFEAGVSALPTEESYLRQLTYISVDLMNRKYQGDLSTGVLQQIVSLTPTLHFVLQGWLGRRTVSESPAGEIGAASRITPTPADAKAYEAAILRLVGCWEQLANFAKPYFDWPDGNRVSNEKAWQTYQLSWRFIWHHLTSTAHMLATSVWNEDEIGARRLRDCLVLWPISISYEFGQDPHYNEARRFILPSLMNLDWAEAKVHLKALFRQDFAEFSVRDAFLLVLRGAHEDVMLLTAALLLSWTANGKQFSNLGAKTALAILQRRQDDPEQLLHANLGSDDVVSLTLHLMRLEIAGARFDSGTYGEDLDHLVRQIDTTTERKVVSGRVYKPSTMQSRYDLHLPIVAILASQDASNLTDEKRKQLCTFLDEEKELLGGDRFVRDTIAKLESAQQSLQNGTTELWQCISLLGSAEKPTDTLVVLASEYQKLLDEINTKRKHELISRQVDSFLLGQLRKKLQDRLLEIPGQHRFFDNFIVNTSAKSGLFENFVCRFGPVSKAQLVRPMMEAPIGNFSESFLKVTASFAADLVWEDFRRLSRSMLRIESQITMNEYWESLSRICESDIPSPILLISSNSDLTALHSVLARPDRGSNIVLSHKADTNRLRHLGAIKGIDVYWTSLPSGSGWLFSSSILKAIRFERIPQSDDFVEIEFQSQDELNGHLVSKFCHTAQWGTEPIYELNFPPASLAPALPVSN